MDSLKSLEEWVKICRAHAKDLPILFCGTKVDLERMRSVPRGYADAFLRPLGLFGHLEVSAKTGENVEKVFEQLVAKIVHPEGPVILQSIGGTLKKAGISPIEE